MGHAAKASVGLSSDPRSSSAPRRFQRFMIGGPFSTVLAPFARWGALRRAAGSLARFSKRLQYFFRSLATPRRLPLKPRAVRGLIPSSLPTSPSRTGRESSSISLARMLPFRPLAALFCSLSLVRSHSAFAIAADGFDRTSFHGFLAKRILLRRGRLLKSHRSSHRALQIMRDTICTWSWVLAGTIRVRGVPAEAACFESPFSFMHGPGTKTSPERSGSH
jgi:hypothetical protein